MQINRLALRAIRESQGITIKDLAAAADLHASTLSRIEGGSRRGTAAQARKLADALRVPLPAITVIALADEAVA